MHSKSKPDLRALYRTNNSSLNEFCQRHPAITHACMSDDGVGLEIVPGKYCISVRPEFEFPGQHTQGDANWESGWAETDTVEEMLNLIKSIRVAHTQTTTFGTFVGKETTTSWSPNYADDELDISREKDGSISLRKI